MIRRIPLALSFTFAAATLAVRPAASVAQQNMDDVEIKVQKVADGVYMLTGRGGNIGLSVGPDGVFVIDDQYAPLTDRILAAIRGVTSEPVRFVINTHWHGDHTGGNENMGRAGALLVAQDNVRRRLSMEQILQRVGRPVDTVAAAPEGALPVVTFSESITFHLNGDDVHAFHVAHAHTDGDAIIHFTQADVVHMGDTFFNGLYPFIDLSTGGSIDGMIAAAGRALAVMDADTRVIPGHGPLGTREDLRAYRDMLKTIRDRIAAEIAAGHTLEQVQASHPTAEWDEEWGGAFISPESLVETIYRSLGGR